jgi:hypothetical protein
MHAKDLYALRESLNSQQIRLCFNGPITHGLIVEMGNALKNYLKRDDAQPGAAMDVFSAYVEMTQNIRRYAETHAYTDERAEAVIVISRDQDERYVVAAGNTVAIADGKTLIVRVEALAKLDKLQLKQTYKEQLHKPRDEAATGAGLGLIDIARKASLPISACLSERSDGHAFFSLFVVI